MSQMNTYTGRKFDPLKMTVEDVSTEDIAHALSLLCRGGGHIMYFYSVGQHCINCYREAEARGWSKRVQLACLLHDASEAYISDIIRPVKSSLTNYIEIENSIMEIIWKKYGLEDITEEECECWRQIDNEILLYELKYMMPGEKDIELAKLSSIPDIGLKKIQDVNDEYIKLINENI